MPNDFLISLSHYGPLGLIGGILVWRLPEMFKVWSDFKHRENEAERRYRIEMAGLRDKIEQRAKKSAGRRV